MKTAVIGTGNMGGALVKGWCKAGMASDLIITAHTQRTRDTITAQYPEVTATLDNTHAAQSADIVILAVKPWLIAQVIEETASSLEGKTLVSVAAGVRHPRIDIYVMPNIAAQYNQSMTFVEAPANEQSPLQQVEQIFSKVGQVKVVSQQQMVSGMLLSGCGIAFAMRYVRALMESGVEMGFYPKDALQIVEQTMLGAVSYLRQSGLHPEAAIDRVTTPGGFTIKGLNAMEKAGFTQAAQAPFATNK